MIVDLVADELDGVHERIAGRSGVPSRGPGVGVRVWAGRGPGAGERVDAGGMCW